MLMVKFMMLAIPIFMISFTLILKSMLMKNEEEKSYKLFIIGGSIIGIYMLFLFGVVSPIFILYAFNQSFQSAIVMYIIILILLEAISFFKSFLKNRSILLKNKGNQIYIRDIEVEYSPAVLSYLMNNKIEKEKDLSATLLNLCAKNIIKLKKNENNKINIIDLKNEEQVKKLSADEEFAYKMFTTQITKDKISTWERKVEQEYEKYKYSKSPVKLLVEDVVNFYMLEIVVLVIISGLKIPIYSEFAKILPYIFPISFAAILESVLLMIVKVVITKKDNYDTYTRKGAIEYNKWKKFEKFIDDFTLVSEKEYESIAVLGKYLSYSIALGINKKCDKELYNEINNKYSFDFEFISNIFKEQNVEKEEI